MSTRCACATRNGADRAQLDIVISGAIGGRQIYDQSSTGGSRVSIDGGRGAALELDGYAVSAGDSFSFVRCSLALTSLMHALSMSASTCACP